VSPARLVPVAVGAVALVVYVLTLMPGVAFSDWGEMQVVPYVLGIAHPTGYPTYIVLAALIDHIPVGSAALLGNLLSAGCTAIALCVAVLIMLRIGVRPVIAGSAALALGAASTVWDAATVAEVNPLHMLFAALLVHRALIWDEHHRLRDLVIGGLLVGLSLGNHLLTVTIAPFVIAFVLWSGRHELLRRPWMLGPAAAAAIVGLAVYLYIPIRASQHPALAYNHPETLDAVLWLVRGTQFEKKFTFLSGEGPARLVEALGAVWTALNGAATPAVILLGLVGLVILVWRRPAIGLMCAGILFGGVYFYATYERLEHYLLVPLLMLAVGASVAVEGLAAAVRGRPAVGRIQAGAIVSGTALVLGVALGAAHWGSSDRSHDRSGETYVNTVMGALPADAAILTGWTVSTPLWYAQLVEGRRPDVLVIDDTNIVYDGWVTRERAIGAHVCARPVYILRVDERDLAPTRREFELEAFLEVDVSTGGPSAVRTGTIYRVLPRDGGCPD